jgi:hypothetical protein
MNVLESEREREREKGGERERGRAQVRIRHLRFPGWVLLVHSFGAH